MRARSTPVTRNWIWRSNSSAAWSSKSTATRRSASFRIISSPFSPGGTRLRNSSNRPMAATGVVVEVQRLEDRAHLLGRLVGACVVGEVRSGDLERAQRGAVVILLGVEVG